MDIVLVTTFIAALFLVIGAAEPLAARLQLPYSVILAILGICIGASAIFFLQTELTDALNPVAEAILGLPIRSNVFLYVFLPTLLFQATLGMNLRRMMDDWVPILVMAVVAVVVATISVGYALSWASGLPLAACLLVGAIVSTTDPSAVVSIFRSISAPRRLGAFRRFVFMPEYDFWAEKLCTIYMARPVRPLGPPTEPWHSTVWASPRVAARELGNSGDRSFVARFAV